VLERRHTDCDSVVAVGFQLENVGLADAMVLQLVNVDDVVLLLIEQSASLPFT